jgi:hypothetical protein
VAGDEPDEEDLASSGSFPNCSSSAGVYDLTGNLWEWVESRRLGVGGGRIGQRVLSKVTFLADCQGLGLTMAPVPFEDELDVGDQAQVDAFMADNFITHSPYADSSAGFRCCR